MSKKTIKNVVETAKHVIKKKDDEIRLLKKKLIDAQGEKVVTFKMPDTVEIRNFPAIQKVQIENHKDIQSVKVTNQKDVQDVRVLNLKQTEFPKVQDVRVLEMPNAEKVSGWVPEIVKHAAGAIVAGFAKRLDLGVLIKADPEDKLRPQVVIVVDERGKPVNFRGLGGTVAIPMPNSPGGNPPPTRIGAGHLTLSTSAQRLSATVIVCRRVIITALATNSGYVYIGDSSVSAQSGSETGAMLTPTGSVSIDIDDLSKVYAISDNAGDIISFTYQR